MKKARAVETRIVFGEEPREPEDSIGQALALRENSGNL
jgi:hypothetical protein